MLFSQLVSALAPQAPEALSAQAGGPGRHGHRELIFCEATPLGCGVVVAPFGAFPNRGGHHTG